MRVSEISTQTLGAARLFVAARPLVHGESGNVCASALSWAPRTPARFDRARLLFDTSGPKIDVFRPASPPWHACCFAIDVPIE
jgi:hypothetical protein